jgi:hypothetical protein
MLGLLPPVLLVTLKVTVQLLLAGIVTPVKLRAVAPAPKEDGAVPTQVPPTAPPAALMLTSVSVNAPPVRAEALLFDKVKVATDVPPGAIEVGLKALAIVGGVRVEDCVKMTQAPRPWVATPNSCRLEFSSRCTPCA